MTYTIEQLTKAGGRVWNGARVYFNDVAELAGLEVTRYGTGNISGGTYKGQHLSNSRLRAHDIHFSMCKLYWDIEKQRFVGTGFAEGEFAEVVAALEARIEQQA